MTWLKYLNDSLGVKIFLGTCLLLASGIVLCVILEKKRLHADVERDDQKILTIGMVRRMLIGMLVGFVVSIVAGVGQFIVRFGYFTLLQEIGVVFLGLIGAIVGALCGLIRWRRRTL